MWPAPKNTGGGWNEQLTGRDVFSRRNSTPPPCLAAEYFCRESARIEFSPTFWASWFIAFWQVPNNDFCKQCKHAIWRKNSV